MNSLRTLLAGIVDYAGLFPPAGLDMKTAARNYQSYRTGDHVWALGRFIVPVSRLGELEVELVTTTGGEGWCVSTLTGSSLDKDIATIFAFNKRQRAVIDTIEVKASTPDAVREVANSVPSILTTFVEVPLEPDPSPLISAIGKSGLRAKARTGGVSAEAFPSSTSLARFLHACAVANVPFKATAGLHHPVRAAYCLTYEPDCPTGMMYGFLNLLFAAAVARGGGSVNEVTAALEETSVSAFHVDDEGAEWGQYKIDVTKLSSLRGEFAISFGSCSFTEPIEELKSIKLL